MMKRNSLPEEHYEYHPHGKNWAVYHVKRNATGSIGNKVKEYLTKQAAIDKVYELNGWNKKK